MFKVQVSEDGKFKKRTNLDLKKGVFYEWEADFRKDSVEKCISRKYKLIVQIFEKRLYIEEIYPKIRNLQNNIITPEHKKDLKFWTEVSKVYLRKTNNKNIK